MARRHHRCRRAVFFYADTGKYTMKMSIYSPEEPSALHAAPNYKLKITKHKRKVAKRSPN